MCTDHTTTKHFKQHNVLKLFSGSGSQKQKSPIKLSKTFDVAILERTFTEM